MTINHWINEHQLAIKSGNLHDINKVKQQLQQLHENDIQDIHWNSLLMCSASPNF